MKLTSKPLAVLIVVILFGGIMLSNSLGWWQTEGGAQGGGYGEGNGAGPAGEQPGEGGGNYASGSVRGRTTFAEVLSWGVAPEAVEAVLGMPMPADQGMVIKDFCTAQGLEFGEVKAALQEAVDAVK